MAFNPNTVLILGAGASQPYGFPLGNQLKQQIIGSTGANVSAQYHQMLEAGFEEDEIDDFHTALVRSMNPTIDSFLEDRPSKRAIGAFAIAQMLMQLENEGGLFPHRDWYPRLFTELAFRESDSRPVVSAIISFNYDRSLEHFLTEVIVRTYEGDAQKAALRKLASIPIIHVHGVLGEYPAVPYSTTRNMEHIKAGAEGIKMIHDDLDDSDEFKKAKILISKADDILFLGFGYHERSIRRLGILENLDRSRIFGTVLGLTPARRSEVAGLFEGQMSMVDGNTDHCIANFEQTKNTWSPPGTL
jgi:hypothetical protein